MHHLEIAIAQLQAGIRPNLNDAIKLGECDRVDLAPDLINRAAARVTAFAALDVVARFSDALAGLGQDMDQPNILHFFCGVDAAAQHHLFGEGRPDATRHQAIGAHARKQAEDILRETEFRVPFRDDHVEREQRLEAAAQRISLRQTR